MQRFVYGTITVALTGMLGLLPAQAADDAYAPVEPVVSTFAGSGQLGTTDGPLDSASFMQPAGITVGGDGTIFLTDLAAQDVRAIRNGVVTTVAGASDPGKTPLQRIGGNLDGPALLARFNRPTGIAAGPDGSLYVTDEMNRAIRKIKGGIVTTFATGFTFPRGIAIDDAGILYVADYGGGLKRITPDGTITTLDYPNDSGVYSVAVQGQGDNLILAYVDRTAIHIVAGGQHRSIAFDLEREPTEQELHVGRAWAITILSRDSVVVTDDLSNAVRFVRFNDGGISAVMTRAFAGGIREGTIETGGYRDGATDRALVDTPYGITRSRDGRTLYVTDSGNRRVRKISNVDGRVASGGVTPLPPVAPSNYRIVFIGASYNFLNTLWPESFAGPVEALLRRNGPAIGLTKPVHVDMLRIDGSGFAALGSLIANYYGDGEADLVVWPVSYGEFGKELQAHADEKPEVVMQGVQKELRDLQALLAAQHTKLLLVVIPQGEQASPLEREVRIEETGRDAYNAPVLYQTARDYEDQIAASGVPTLKLVRPMQELEESSQRFPLYNTWDYHLSTQGSTWVGIRIAAELERWQPWR